MAKSVKTERLLDNNESQEESELFVPLKESDFKPRLNKNVCPYCGYTSGNKTSIDKHINSKHEMSIWYKCKYCKHASTDSCVMILHIKRHHKFQVNFEDIRPFNHTRSKRDYLSKKISNRKKKTS